MINEHDWLSLTNVEDVYGELAAVVQPRKLFLLGAVFLRRVWDDLAGEDTRQAVRVTEEYAHGRASVRDLLESWTRAEVASEERLWFGPHTPSWCYCDCCPDPLEAFNDPIHPGAQEGIRDPAHFAARACWVARGLSANRLAESRAQLGLVHDIIGDPYQQPRPAPAWLKQSRSLMQMLASLPRQAPDPLAMLALADAMEEAGCDNPAALTHCREHPEHGQGCWVVEWLLGHERIEVPVDDEVMWLHQDRW